MIFSGWGTKKEHITQLSGLQRFLVGFSLLKNCMDVANQLGAGSYLRMSWSGQTYLYTFESFCLCSTTKFVMVPLLPFC